MAERAARGVAVPNLRVWRMYHALSQGDLAEQSGVSRPAIARAEGGARLSFENIRKLATALDLTVHQLLHESPAPQTPPSSPASLSAPQPSSRTS